MSLKGEKDVEKKSASGGKDAGSVGINNVGNDLPRRSTRVISHRRCIACLGHCSGFAPRGAEKKLSSSEHPGVILQASKGHASVSRSKKRETVLSDTSTAKTSVEDEQGVPMNEPSTSANVSPKGRQPVVRVVQKKAKGVEEAAQHSRTLRTKKLPVPLFDETAATTPSVQVHKHRSVNMDQASATNPEGRALAVASKKSIQQTIASPTSSKQKKSSVPEPDPVKTPQKDQDTDSVRKLNRLAAVTISVPNLDPVSKPSQQENLREKQREAKASVINLKRPTTTAQPSSVLELGRAKKFRNLSSQSPLEQSVQKLAKAKAKAAINKMNRPPNAARTSSEMRYHEPQLLGEYHITWDGFNEPDNTMGQPCCLCDEDLALSLGSLQIDSEYATLAVAAMLPCGHAFHTYCLDAADYGDNKGEPPCVICVSLDS